MALANIVSNAKSFVENLGVAEFGASNFMRVEDQFITAGNPKNSALTTWSPLENNPQEVIIACKNKKRRVCGILDSGIKLSAEAKWDELFGGGITALGGSLVNMVNKGAQFINGTSLQQPWMNRKFWNSTKPYSFTFSFNFISDEHGGKADVYDPVIALQSFVYPRDLGKNDEIARMLNDTKIFDLEQKNSKGRDGVLKSTIDTFARDFAIPGPSIGYMGAASEQNGNSGGDASRKNGGGDAVTLVIGNLFAFGGVYLEKVETEMSPNMDATGYPLWAKCTVTATVMDANFCNTNGDFLINQYADKQSSLSNLVDSLKTTGGDLVSGISNIAKTTFAGIKG